MKDSQSMIDIICVMCTEIEHLYYNHIQYIVLYSYAS